MTCRSELLQRHDPLPLGGDSTLGGLDKRDALLYLTGLFEEKWCHSVKFKAVLFGIVLQRNFFF